MKEVIKLFEFLDLVEVCLIRRALKATDYNKKKSAELLGIKRTTLEDKTKGYGINSITIKEIPVELSSDRDFSHLVNELGRFYRETELIFLRKRASELLRNDIKRTKKKI